ncbi:hypothetical protein ABEF92_004174 [Exophiala dermatitidis]|uniref:Aminoglycoside phosphotransferase domain-containing protein n=2 Tax=Exophiala dermatitidis TaxID=5970 RepID=H6C8S5_EXODN|nr:uncharacterized protein HMPREF1120_08458 [Exophiala dermatitidis NIH/UT8656]EHY60502.1 hypothetical protein HMPREF1120_08458 [Exophiala dermatitidis NIH/UT8656]
MIDLKEMASHCSSRMTPRKKLLHKSISYESACGAESNMLLQLSYPSQRIDFFLQLFQKQDEIKEIVARHMGLRSDQACQLGDFSEWRHGTFNVCIPVYIRNWNRRPRNRVMIRFPLPYKLGESSNPGNTDEKVRSEVATYIWMQQNCPEIPTPYLWGFGIGKNLHFTACENAPWYLRCLSAIQNTLRLLFRQPTRSPYIRRKGPDCPFPVGYLLMDFVEEEEGRMLSTTWDTLSSDSTRKANFFRDLSQIWLSLTRRPLPHIGSWMIDDQGVVSLANRPLSIIIPEAENDSCPPVMNRSCIYSTVEPYVLDLLEYHDNRIRYQPNSVISKDDAVDQMEALTLMRACFPDFVNRHSRSGPFYLTLTDLHQSNIFVDDDWHIKFIIDLEWACSRPIEMLRPPLWLTGQAIDCLVEEKLTDLKLALDEFFLILEEEEKRSWPPCSFSVANCFRENWATGRIWYFRALDSLTGLYGVFLNHIEPIFASDITKTAARYWHPDAENIVRRRVEDKLEYDRRLRQAFEQDSKSEG